MERIEELSRELCKEIDVLYWRDAIMGAKMRGSKTRVPPHIQMLSKSGYLKQVVIMGVLETVLFDALYLDHYKNVTGVDFRLQWSAIEKRDATTAIKDDSSSVALETLAEFLKSGNISLVGSNPRHSLLIKFKIYLESQQNARS